MSLILPSYQSGFAPRDYEPAYPSLWQGCVAAYAPLLGPTGLVLRDAVGKNDGVLTNGPTYQAKNGRYALDCDGSNDYVAVSHNSRLNFTSEFSFSAWVVKTSSSACNLLGKQNVGVNDGNYAVISQATNNLQFGFVTSVANTRWSTTGAVFTLNALTHVVVTIRFDAASAATIKVYANGVEQIGSWTTASGIGIPLTNTNPVAIFAASDGSINHFPGQLFEMRLYNRILTEGEVKTLAVRPTIAHEPIRRRRTFFRGFSPKKKLLEAKITSTIPGSYQTGYAPRDGEPVYPELWRGCVGAWSAGLGATGGILRDQSGLDNHGTLTNMDPGTDWVISNGSYALDFDGVNDSVDIGRPAVIDNLINDYTITAWVRPTGSFANFRNIIAKGDLISLQFGIIVPSTGIWRAQFTDANDVTGGQLTLNKWSFVAYKMSAGVATTYQDGLAVNSGSRTTSTKAASFEIGRDTPNNRNFLGNIDDVRLYNRPLSDSEIKTLATRRNIAYEYKRPRTLFRAYDPIKQVGVGKITSIIPGGYHTGVGGVNNEPAYPELTKGLVGGWCPSLGVTGGLLRDNSGQGNHGTLTNGPAWQISGGKYALDFDGSDDYVNISRSFYGTGSIAFWVKTATELAAAVAFGTNASSANLMYIGLGQNISGTLTDELITAATVTTSARIEGYTTANRNELFDNNWHHVCVLQRTANSSYEFYLDGNKKATTVGDASLATFGIGISSGDLIQFGSRRFNASQGVFLNGQLDDIRLYNRGLSPNEIRLLASRRGIGYDYKTHRSYSKTQSSGLRKRILTGLP